jgi:DNA repair protein RadC
MPARRRDLREPPAHTIHAMASNERPRERLQQLGAGVLSDVELLAILLRTGYRGSNVIEVAQQLLEECGRLGGLARTPFEQLKKVKGVGPAKATELFAAFELGRRAMNATLPDQTQIKSPDDAVKMLGDMACLEKEEMRVLFLNQKNIVIGKHRVYEGSLHTTVVRVSEIFKEAVRRNCAGLIVAHNHPSGDPTPSPEDAALTRELVKAGQLLDIDVLDHIVIGASGKFTSLKDRGLGFDK